MSDRMQADPEAMRAFAGHVSDAAQRISSAGGRGAGDAAAAQVAGSFTSAILSTVDRVVDGAIKRVAESVEPVAKNVSAAATNYERTDDNNAVNVRKAGRTDSRA